MAGKKERTQESAETAPLPDPPSLLERMGQGSVLLLVAAAVAITVGAILGQTFVLVLAGLCALGGILLLVATALKGGRDDAP